MLRGEKILITGPAGRIAFPLAQSLVAENEVWGVARFSAPGSRERVESIGVTTRALDIADAVFEGLPNDFTYLLHLAADFSDDDYDRALRVNAEATGFLLEHCRKVKAALVMSTLTTYAPHPDPWHAFREDDPLGDARATPSAPYSVSKIAQEAVARYCARSFGVPVLVARMGAAYGDNGGLPVMHLGGHRGRSTGADAVGPDPLQPHPQRRHRRPGPVAPRCGERAGHGCELVW